MIRMGGEALSGFWALLYAYGVDTCIYGDLSIPTGGRSGGEAENLGISMTDGSSSSG
jgi:hypothetical protein